MKQIIVRALLRYEEQYETVQYCQIKCIASSKNVHDVITSLGNLVIILKYAKVWFESDREYAIQQDKIRDFRRSQQNLHII